jgi:hypothetical protein
MRTTSYVNLLKGLIREAVVADAFNKLYRKIIKNPHASKSKFVIPWGSEATGKKGKEGAIDLLINTCFNEKETKKLFN